MERERKVDGIVKVLKRLTEEKARRIQKSIDSYTEDEE